MKREEILLEFIYLPIEGKSNFINPLQIMNAMFLLKQDLNLSDFYEFEPYFYGPCSFEIYSDLMSLINENLIITLPSFRGWKYYGISEKGRKIAEENYQKFDEKIIKKLIEIKKLVTSLSFIDLLRYVYEKFPEYSKNSIINIEAL